MAAGKNSFTIGFDASDLEVYLDQLGDNAAKAIRPAAQAAAQVLYERVRLNVQAIGKVTGNLDSSIYQAYSPEHSANGVRAEYHVSWNHLKAPHGHLLEQGYLQRYRYYQDNQGRVRPMVRPGMEGRRPPSRRASDEQKAAYYVTLDTPRHVPGRFFVQRAADALPEAYLAAEDVLVQYTLRFKGGE